MKKTLTSRQAFERYEAVRERFPALPFADLPTSTPVPQVPHLEAVADQYDAFVFDAFGVLNVGEVPIEGAVERIAELRAQGKRLFVLTNAASYAFEQVVEKFIRLGFDFRAEELVSSRAVCELHLSHWGPDFQWGVIAPTGFSAQELDQSVVALADEPALYDAVDGFLFLSSECWTEARQDLLAGSLAKAPRPVVVANPDLVAPREIGLTVEPGYYAHDLMDRVTGLQVAFHGKPFPSVYDHVEALVGPSYPVSRIAMVGDSLHTDIWGAMVRGWGSVLVSDHGFLKGQDPMAAILESRLYPSCIVPQI
ncbi:HAD-IIA family hydrolase [Cohaesibacter intestini]|uniref:HAD-IIA family hydrolase n=1 Tax=Cohaesibacter intestini TaxID=2211145 RepID=UPI0018E50A84|nr:HAD family hydrolase [Cohaesibacter intestini]